jgi:SAM-dependent methyltransferase
MTYRKRTTCRLCDSTQLIIALHYPPQPLADAYLKKLTGQTDKIYPLDLYLCEECGCAQLLDVVSGDEIYPQYTYETGSSPALVEHFQQYALDVYEKIQPNPSGLIVDIGGNDGTLLDWFRMFGMRAINIDPAPVNSNIEDMVRIYRFFDAANAEFIQSKWGHASIVTANNVYANIDDLRSFTEAVRNLLAPDGVFVFETFYLADFIDNMVFDFIYHEHLTAFSLAPLIGFFQRLGMQIFDVQRVPTKGGSIRVYVQHEGGRRPVTPDVPALVEWEYLRGLHKLQTYYEFAHKISLAQETFWHWLLSSTPQKAIIAGYGASPTSTTLIYNWSLGAHIDYLIDDWPAKQGTFSPGLHLPVYESDQSLNGFEMGRHPDYVIILAWRYAEQIMARNPGYRGTWIVPLPELRVIKANSLAIGSGIGEPAA